MFKSLSQAVKKMFGTKYDKDVNKYMPYVHQINDFQRSFEALTNDELREKTTEFRARIAEYLSDIDTEITALLTQAEESDDVYAKEDIFTQVDTLRKDRDKATEEVLWEILPEAFAVVKETARRFSNNPELRVKALPFDHQLASDFSKKHIQIVGEDAIWKNRWLAAGGEITWNMVHYDVQLIGGMVLHDGKIAEMATGEGKTLVATLPAYLNGLTGQGVHVITVNDYLARRDSEWIGPIFEFLLLTVDCIDKYKPHSAERVKAYRSDITYGTNNEFGFDYLRDNMVRSQEEVVQGKHHFAMVDEVDSVLIDDARTPLIISGPITRDSDDQEYMVMKPFVERLIEEQRRMATKFLAEARKKFAEGNTAHQEGGAGIDILRSYRALPKNRPLIKFLSEDGARVMLQKTENHYMQEQSKNMHLVDEPLLFVIDEKNRSVELTENGAEFLSKGTSDPNMFVVPDLALRLQEIDEQEELSKVEREEAKIKLSQEFAIKTQRLHVVSQMLKAYTLFERDDEYVVMEGQVKIIDEQTGRMMEGRRYSDGLHQALEAKENVKVGELTQTYATITLQNYFRMYHKLAGMTGTAETEATEFWEIYKLDVVVIPTNRPISRDDKDDLVFKTEREKFNAVIDEVVALSQAGRPILVGTTSVDISEKLSRMLTMRGINHNVLNAKQHQREAEIVAEAGRPGKVTIATNMAGRGTDIKISEEVKRAGGLAIIGTERHESRRVDRQLRGRAGRQGDPGSSQFYVSLEDNLMRLFNSERIAKMMDSMGHKEGDVIQAGLVTKSIERAQKKVEENNFGIRKRLLEYDDAMNIQRETIYKKRNNALSGERLSVDVFNMFQMQVETLVHSHKEYGDFESFRRQSIEILGLDTESVNEVNFKEKNAQNLVEIYFEELMEFYGRKTDHMIDALLPQIKYHYEANKHFKRIIVPLTDGRSEPYVVTADIEQAVKTNGKSIIRDIEKNLVLSILDEKWKDHLRNMDELKDTTQSASFEQKDPIVVYKIKAFEQFETLIMEINKEVTSYLAQSTVILPESSELQQARTVRRPDSQRLQTNKSEEQTRRAAESVSRPEKPQTVIRTEKKVGRNDVCPCGSGKKFKNCHGK